jgi:hypothetical protein
VFVHALVQYVRPVVQQWLFEHDCALVHAAPHLPQFALSIVVSTQLDEQHDSCAQSVVQFPQCVLSVVVSKQPFVHAVTPPSPVHCTVQTFATHAHVPPPVSPPSSEAAHAFPHLPQFVTSVLMSTHVPLQSVPPPGH